MARGSRQAQAPLIAAATLLVLAAGCLQAPAGFLEEEIHEDHPHAHDDHASADETHAHGSGLGPAGFDPRNAPDLSHEPPFPLEDGRRPTLDEAKAFTKKYSRFIAKGDAGIEKLRAEGHLRGDGTQESPYILEEFYVEGELSLTSLHKAIILRNGYVGGQLRLNYIGDDVYVHHVYAKDLRVNENIKRNGTNTGGLFHDNHFSYVGQIRHFTGEFLENAVGPKPKDAISESLGDSGVVKVPPEVVFNFDGFHGADVHHNQFLGQVDIKLHGHNHGDCFTCPAHDHADLTDKAHVDHQVPANPHGFTSVHSIRYTSLLFRDNTITVPAGVALRYHDTNHAGDDRTAASEPHERLNDAHIHYQDVTIRNNRLLGGSLLIDVFNAPDERHPTQNQGILRLWGNEIRADYTPPTLTRSSPSLITGIQLRRADGLELHARANTIQFQQLASDRPGDALLQVGAPKVEIRGIHLDTVADSNLTITQTLVQSGRYGVYAQGLTATTHWWLLGNQFQTQEPWRGNNVANPPKED